MERMQRTCCGFARGSVHPQRDASAHGKSSLWGPWEGTKEKSTGCGSLLFCGAILLPMKFNRFQLLSSAFESLNSVFPLKVTYNGSDDGSRNGFFIF